MDLFDEEELYELAAEELESSGIRKGRWIKALTEANGDENTAKAIYIKSRVQQYKAIKNAARMEAIKEVTSSSLGKLVPVVSGLGITGLFGITLVGSMMEANGTLNGLTTTEFMSWVLLGVSCWLFSGLLNLLIAGKFVLLPGSGARSSGES